MHQYSFNKNILLVIILLLMYILYYYIYPLYEMSGYTEKFRFVNRNRNIDMHHYVSIYDYAKDEFEYIISSNFLGDGSVIRSFATDTCNVDIVKNLILKKENESYKWVYNSDEVHIISKSGYYDYNKYVSELISSNSVEIMLYDVNKSKIRNRIFYYDDLNKRFWMIL